MKYTSRERDDGGGCVSRRKRIKHEPLSPPMYHSEDEQSSLSDESEDEELLSSSSSSNDNTKSTITGEHEDEIKNGISNNRLKQETLDDDVTTITNDKGGEICEIQTRVGSNPIDGDDDSDDDCATSVASPDARLTSLTSPLDTTQAIDSDQITPPYTERYTQNNRDHLNHHHHNHSQPYRRPSISRDRRDEIRLSEHQQEHLDQILATIKEGDFDKFSELLGKRGDSIKSLLNVFVRGRTALHWSLLYGRSLAWSRQLIMNGANPNLANKDGWFPIHLAAYNGCTNTVSYLLDHIAEW